MAIFTTVTDIATQINHILAGSDGTYDADAIAAEISEWTDGRLTADLDRTDFWDIVAKHEI